MGKMRVRQKFDNIYNYKMKPVNITLFSDKYLFYHAWYPNLATLLCEKMGFSKIPFNK